MEFGEQFEDLDGEMMGLFGVIVCDELDDRDGEPGVDTSPGISEICVGADEGCDQDQYF